MAIWLRFSHTKSKNSTWERIFRRVFSRAELCWYHHLSQERRTFSIFFLSLTNKVEGVFDSLTQINEKFENNMDTSWNISRNIMRWLSKQYKLQVKCPIYTSNFMFVYVFAIAVVISCLLLFLLLLSVYSIGSKLMWI